MRPMNDPSDTMPLPGQTAQEPGQTSPFIPPAVTPSVASPAASPAASNAPGAASSGDTAPLPSAATPQPTQAMPPGFVPAPAQAQPAASSSPAAADAVPLAGQPAQPSAETPRARSGSPRRIVTGGWRVAQGLLTLGAALFIFAAWANWAIAAVFINVRVANGVSVICAATDTGCQQKNVNIYLNPGEIGAPPLLGALGAQGAFFWWSVLTVVGLLLCPFLWQTARAWLARLALAVYTLWALGMTVICARVGAILTQNFGALTARGATQSLYVTALNRSVAIQSAQVGPGLTLAIVALALAFLGVAISIVMAVTGAAPATTAPVTANLSQAERGQRARAALPGASVVTLGLVLWVWGFFLLPWATVNCNKTPLLIGTCYGLPVSSALQVGLYSPIPTIDSYIGVYTVGALLLMGAILIAITLWRRAINRALCLWASLWLVVAFTFALVASQGAALAVARPAFYNLGAGVWRGDSGVLVVFLALLAVLVGLVPLWAVAERRHRLILRANDGG